MSKKLQCMKIEFYSDLFNMNSDNKHNTVIGTMRKTDEKLYSDS